MTLFGFRMSTVGFEEIYKGKDTFPVFFVLIIEVRQDESLARL